MNANDENKLGEFLREVSNWNWGDFCLAENDPNYTTNEALIFALIRACVMEKMDAIKLALNRLDGKLKTPIKIEYPKVFFLFPNATLEKPTKRPELPGEVMKVEQPVEPEAEDETDLSELSLRQTLTKMSDHPRQVPDAIIAFAQQTQQWMKGNAEEPVEKPMVKSVVAAHLLKMAQRRDIAALNEVFDQIDGKMVETYQILGDNLYITNYSQVAPEGAYLNEDGVVQIEAVQAQQVWTDKLMAEQER